MSDDLIQKLRGNETVLGMVRALRIEAADALATKDTALSEAKRLSDRWEEGFKHLERLCAEWKTRADETASELNVAATALSEMRAELDRARKALGPFAKLAAAPGLGVLGKTDDIFLEGDGGRVQINIDLLKALRIAARALASQDDGEERK